MKNQTIISNYIGKVICKLLGYSENSYVCKQMNELTNYVKTMNFEEINSLLADGSIGVSLAAKIAEDYEEKENRNMLMRFYNMFLSEIANLTAMGLYDDAIDEYSQMVLVLGNHFGIIDLKMEVENKKTKKLMTA